MPYYKVDVDWEGNGQVSSSITHDSLTAVLSDVDTCLRWMTRGPEQTIVTIHRIPNAVVNQHMPNE